MYVVVHICSVIVALVARKRRWRDKESAETRANDIHEYPRNRLLNRSKTILIWILSVTLAFLYFYFGKFICIQARIITQSDNCLLSSSADYYPRCDCFLFQSLSILQMWEITFDSISVYYFLNKSYFCCENLFNCHYE